MLASCVFEDVALASRCSEDKEEWPWPW